MGLFVFSISPNFPEKPRVLIHHMSVLDRNCMWAAFTKFLSQMWNETRAKECRIELRHVEGKNANGKTIQVVDEELRDELKELGFKWKTLKSNGKKARILEMGLNNPDDQVEPIDLNFLKIQSISGIGEQDSRHIPFIKEEKSLNFNLASLLMNIKQDSGYLLEGDYEGWAINEWLQLAVESKIEKMGQTIINKGDCIKDLMKKVDCGLEIDPEMIKGTKFRVAENQVLGRFKRMNTCVMVHHEQRLLYFAITEPQIEIHVHEKFGKIYFIPMTDTTVFMVFEDDSIHKTCVELVKDVANIIEVSSRR